MDLEQFEIHIITHMENLPEKKSFFEGLGCIVHEFHRVHGHSITKQNISEYRCLFRAYSFDVVHNNLPENLLPLYFAKKQHVPVRLLHAHNDYLSGVKRNIAIIAAYKAGYALNASWATDLLAASVDAGVSTFGKGARKRLSVFPNAIDVDAFAYRPSVREQYRRKLGLGDEVCVGHIGRYESDQKNQEFVLFAFKAFKEKHHNAILLMIGEGKRRREFMDMSQDMGLAKSVVFTGAVPDVPGYLQAMDIFLLPSRKEGLGIVAIEAQAAGLRCIVSDRVPEEAGITKGIQFLSIENGVEQWVEQMISAVGYDRVDTRESIVKAGFSIEGQAFRLEELYVR